MIITTIRHGTGLAICILYSITVQSNGGCSTPRSMRAISAQGINQKYTQFRKTPIGDNPAFTFRTFLLRLGLIGPEYKNVRMHLLKNLPGDKAWRHDKSLYPSNQPRPRTDEVR